MLKALELVGFKSFADKTRLEFPKGITVVVGPNGSGKSNIVDAIKWVLGEQSVKSLRGKEMADVIFNGSAHRRPLNSAETTLSFDNSERRLPIDTPEVHITRRVYRNGEGEYLINRQPARLRDIRDLLSGTGMATEAYSVIEQGKVDVLLQASARDRRAIFEEAAGISRFKAKKIEAHRRLERVEQNLLRLCDIVDEVDNRLRTVRAQAAKARKYKEYADRLQELRTQVGLTDWRKLSNQLAGLEGELTQMRDQAAGAAAEIERLEAQVLGLELEIVEAEEAIRSNDARVAQNRERIAAYEATIDHQRRLSADLEQEVARYRRQLTAMNLRAGNLDDQLRETVRALESAENEHRRHARGVADRERTLTDFTHELDALAAHNEQDRAEHLTQLRAASALGNQISALESRSAAAKEVCDRGDARRNELQAALDALAGELTKRRAQLATAIAEHEARQRALDELRAQVTRWRSEAATARRELAAWRERHTGAHERATVLEELERRLEGLSLGVREMLVAARENAAGPYRHIRGVVADLLHVHMDTAPIIETALGEVAQYVVATHSHDLIAHFVDQAGAGQPAGRVGVVRLDVLPALTGGEQIDLTAQPGVIGRADRFVETAPEFAVLAKRLLGKTWIVETLADAVHWAQATAADLQFVTRACELVAADGTLVVGPRQSATGLISRRAELRTLRGQIADLAAKIERGQSEVAALDERIASGDQQAGRLEAEHRTLANQLAIQRLEAGAAEERNVQLERQAAGLDAELAAAAAEHQTAAAALARSRGRLAETEGIVGVLETRLRANVARASEVEQLRDRSSRDTSAARVELARSEQQLDHLRTQRSQLERDQQERARAIAESQSQLALAGTRARDAERNILAAESAVAELFLRKEVLTAANVEKIQRRESSRQLKAELGQEAQRTTGRMRKLETRLHAKELAASEVRHERTTLADRLREDYGIELAALDEQPTPEGLEQRQQVEAEIADLRAKLNSIGGVNLDALGEVEELETRFANLSAQRDDLTAAKNSLEQIIGKIDADSRHLFGDTLSVVREHFQTLFRKLFGGGQADIVLEEGVDILDSGIEIVARPPGKEPRSISLLSGGERTLTCVALLLAIFRSRPSPFCVLDEVDAALDEANIDRFLGVLREFLAWTQFIVVTHSKKTMIGAETLYGITMQESGVSKRVSVRFEDVSENGEFKRYEEIPEPTTGADGQAA
ncbi:MAG TPA: chromosome segregation protein SMC [Pirellulales bacterium]|nr:chromosome segregation protein SMC [Pirellulales bacterium]